ncbi:response regulator [Blautia liquoris]|uniref:Stage 0 sporulation protein A homolog n=1 Tax=Blautia liquoris TaxID=2779518 RepID=A0A7M2RL25_9FIRM|nr:response regulator [Blautia liquoris]QOV20257.1 response regulator [Blautia liquoris]
MYSSQYTVIIAEDEELLLTNLVSKINNLGTDFIVTGQSQTGIQAYDLVKELQPDLLITDIRMPIMDGLTLIKNVKEYYPMTQFIITSGFSDFDYAKSAISLGVSEYLLKPIDSDELKKALSKVEDYFSSEENNYIASFSQASSRSTPDEIAEMVRDYIVKNYASEINLNLMAKSLHYSSSYLTKIFCSRYQCTPSKYLINLRIQKARSLLSHHPEYTIRQVGESVGYTDQGYFSRIFKRQTGVSPFEYREMQIHP